MTTVVNNPSSESDRGGSNFIIGIVLLLGMVMIVVFFGLPVLKSMGPVQINLPETRVAIPDKINVNVTQEK